MERAEINSLFDDFNENYIEKSISKKVKLSLEYFAHSYIIVDLRVNDYTYKSFSYEEIINYDSSRLPYDPHATLEEFFQKWLEVPNKERNVYTGWELISALKKYMYAPYPNETGLDDPLNLMFYILDERTDISRFDATKINHEWLTGLYNLRLTGECGNDFLARKKVILDLASCTYPREVKREIRTKMKFFFYYGDGLDALWDILTGMYFYGDDFVIKRKKTYKYAEYGRTVDFTDVVDKTCKLFKEASESIYSDITVKIEFVD